MTATILQFPLQRRLSPQLARLVQIAATRAAGMGHACDLSALAHMLQRWHANETPHDRELLAKARAAIAALPPRRPQP